MDDTDFITTTGTTTTDATAPGHSGGAPAGPPAGPKPRPAFRLHRSRSLRMIGGVCGGLAESLDVDVTLVRIGAVALTLLGGGIGIPLYIAAWIIVPED